MMKLFKILILLFWAIAAIVFFKYQLYIDGTDKITSFISAHQQYSALLFFTIASLRVFTLVPCTVFIIIGGILFSPLQAFVLITIANLLSEALLFFFARMTFGMNYQARMVEKYPKIYNMINKNNVQILALGVSSPVVPTDVVCFFSALSGMSFFKYILTILFADTPIILLYTFLGISFQYSVYVFIVTVIAIALFSYFNFRKWNHQSCQAENN